MSRPAHYKFRSVFQSLGVVESLIDSNEISILSELDWKINSASLVEILYKPSKFTVLHHFIRYVLENMDTEDIYYRDDICIDNYLEYPYEESIMGSVDREFLLYGVEVLPFKQFAEQWEIDNGEDSEPSVRDWFNDQIDSFSELWEKKTHEAFHFLFSNRNLLTHFHLMLAEFIRVELAPSGLITPYTAQNGRIKRVLFPKWLKQAVFHRDKGRCVYCDKDLSGIIHPLPKEHFDHIVPLSKYGTNDPTNIQLTCSDCNQRKSDQLPSRPSRYWTWWSFD